MAIFAMISRGSCSSKLQYGLLEMTPGFRFLLASWEKRSIFQIPVCCAASESALFRPLFFSTSFSMPRLLCLCYPSPLWWTNAATTTATSLTPMYSFLYFVECTQISESPRDSDCPVLNFSEFLLSPALLRSGTPAAWIPSRGANGNAAFL